MRLSQLKRSIFIASCTLVLAASAGQSNGSEESAVSRAATRILRHQVSDGAIVMGEPSSQSRVVPYFANQAAHGLVSAYVETRKPGFLEAAKRWISWYESHLNPDGTVYDYEGSPGAWKGTGDYDSTDSYAATYLEVVLATARAANDPDWISARLPSVRRALSAIELTLQQNGLSIAKPKYHMMYVMDNVETARGLRAGSEIAAELGELKLLEDTRSMALRLEGAIQSKLWDPADKRYYVALQKGNVPVAHSEKWYPNIMANLMAIGWMREPQERHVDLLLRLLQERSADRPAAIRNEADLGKLVWWAFAAKGTANEKVFKELSEKLGTFDRTAFNIANPATLGHVCRILARGEPPHETPLVNLRSDYDVVIAGAGTGGFGAAVQAARLGMTVLLLEETDWIGGQMTAAAVTSMDEGPMHKIRPYVLVRERGIYNEFSDAVLAAYKERGMNANRAYWNARLSMEPRTGQEVLYRMLDEARTHTAALHVLLRTKVTAVRKSGNKVTGVRIAINEPGGAPKEIRSKILIDATEWGDVLSLTDVPYRVGNCTSDAVDTNRLVQKITWTAVIKEYAAGLPAELLLTNPPPGYAAAEKIFRKSVVPGKNPQPNAEPWDFERFIGYRGMPDSDQPFARGFTRTHMNYCNDYPITTLDLEDSKARELTCREAALRTLNLLYFVQHVLGKTNWSVATDEGYDTPYNREQVDRWVADQPEIASYRAMLYHFSIIPYVRESKRMIGLHTLISSEIERRPRSPKMFETSIALGDYAVDLHGSSQPNYLELNLDKLEDVPKTFAERGWGPFAIPFECLIPEKLDGFLAAEKNFSQSRLANGATRLQPSTMLIGQAVGAIAGLSIQKDIQPRQLDPVLVQRLLLAAGDTLQIVPLLDVSKSGPEWPAIQLVTVRGLMSLRDGKFEPAALLKPADLSYITDKLFGKTAQMAEPIKRNVLAKTLAPLMRVDKVALVLDAEVSERPVTRIEAAQVFADFLEARALARLTRKEQTLDWTSIVDVTPLTRNDVAPSLENDVQCLARAGIIVSPDYWIGNALEGKSCDGKMVQMLLERTAKKLRPASSEKDMFKVCLDAGLFQSPDYWVKSAVEGGRCSGLFVGTVIRRIAERIESPR